MLRFVEKGRLDTVVNFHNIVVLDCCTQNLIIRFFVAALEKLIRRQIGMSFIGFRISQVIFQQQSVWDHVKGAHALDSSKDFDRSTITAVEAVAGRPMNALLPRTLDRDQMLSSLFITINLELLDRLLPLTACRVPCR